jgi:hypothetical protein
MKKIISKTWALVAIAAALLSFTPNFGGEGFEILVNGKMVVQKFGGDMDHVKFLELSRTQPTDKLSVKYYHCGRVGKNRTITIKDADEQTLKVFRFTDVSNPVGEMSCTIQDLLSLRKGNSNVLKMYYSSTELPKGRQLAAVILGKTDKVAP